MDVVPAHRVLLGPHDPRRPRREGKGAPCFQILPCGESGPELEGVVPLHPAKNDSDCARIEELPANQEISPLEKLHGTTYYKENACKIIRCL